MSTHAIPKKGRMIVVLVVEVFLFDFPFPYIKSHTRTNIIMILHIALVGKNNDYLYVYCNTVYSPLPYFFAMCIIVV